MLSLSGVLLFSQMVFARDIAPQELQVYTAQVHHADYSKLSDDVKKQISEEYKKRVQLAEILTNKLKMDPEYNYASESLVLDLWSKRLASSIKPTDETLKILFNNSKDLKVAPSYNLRHIVLKDTLLADEILLKLNKEEKNKRAELFSSFVEKNSLDTMSKINKGSIGWIDAGKLSAQTMQSLKDKSTGDVIKLSDNKDFLEIIIIDEIKPEHPASFEEAKPFLINVIKKQNIENIAKEMLITNNKLQSLTPTISPKPIQNKSVPIKPIAPLK